MFKPVFDFFAAASAKEMEKASGSSTKDAAAAPAAPSADMESKTKTSESASTSSSADAPSKSGQKMPNTTEISTDGKEKSHSNVVEPKTESDEGNISDAIAAATRKFESERSLEYLAEIGKKSQSALLSTALKTSLSEVLRKSIEANSAEGGNKAKPFLTKCADPSCIIPSGDTKTSDIYQSVSTFKVAIKKPDLARATAGSSKSAVRTDVSQSSVPQQSDEPVATCSITPASQEPSAVAHSSKASTSGNVEAASSSVVANVPVIKQEPGTSGSLEKTPPKRKSKKRHFKGGTYGLYLSPARKKKKIQRKPGDSNSKDDELSLASTENGSFVDSEDGCSMFSEDFNTPSEKSLVDEEGCSNSRCSPLLVPPDQLSEISDSKDLSMMERHEIAPIVKVPTIDETPTTTSAMIFEVVSRCNSQQQESGDSETKDKHFAVEAAKEARPYPSSDADASVEQKYVHIDADVKVTPPANSEESAVKKTGPQAEATLPKKPENSMKATSRPGPSKPPGAEANLPCEHSNPPKSIGLSTIATSVKSRQRMKRKFTDDIVDTDIGILSLNSMSCRKAKGDLSQPPQTSDILENFKACCEGEARQKPVIKTEFVFNSKQKPVTECTCAGNCVELTLHNQKPMFCQAVDSIDDKFVGCCNPVTNFRLVRSSVRIRYTVMCEMHLWRLRHHHACPRCGLFCSQGSFMQCETNHGDKREVHFFHVQCELNALKNPEICPHCSRTDGLKVVNLEANIHAPMFLLKQNCENLQAKARIICLPPLRSRSEPVVADPAKSFIISDRILCSYGLSSESNRTDLESLLMQLRTENLDNLPDYSPQDLYKAVKNSTLKDVLYILAKGVNPDHKFEEHDGNTALHIAAASGDVVIVHLLVQAGSVLDPMNQNLRTPLMLATEHNKEDVVQYLVKKRVCLNTKGESGMTCLHLAAREGFLNLCMVIVDSGKALVDAQDDGGWTPIVWASEHGHAAVVRYLLTRGGNPEIRDNEGNTALHWAAFSGSVEVCTLCLDAGCDVNEVNEHGDTPLHIAARQDNYACIDLLLLRNARVDIKNKASQHPIDCCVTSQDSLSRRAIYVNHTFKDVFEHQNKKKRERVLFRDIALGRERYPIRCVNGVDETDLNLKEFLYVTENCETCPIKIDRCITTLQHCDCTGDCSTAACPCSAVSFRCWYDKDGHLVPEFNTVEPPLLFECNRACVCDVSICRNRVVQKGMTCRLELVRTEGRGWGVRTLKDIPKGTFICEYVGELISDSEADTRQDDSYLFDLDNKDGETYCLDARHFGNISRFINHFCEPNLVPVKVFVDHQDLSFPRIAFFSVRDINQYEELGFDYGEKFWVIKSKSFTCNCKSPRCKYSKEMIHKTLAKESL